jgi:SPP1 gp7 family putative phage head morphogenesis protein
MPTPKSVDLLSTPAAQFLALRGRRALIKLRKRKGRVPRPPRPKEPRGLQLQYQKFLRELLKDIHADIRAILYPALEPLTVLAPVPTRDGASHLRLVRLDAPADELLDRTKKKLRETVTLRVQENVIAPRVQRLGQDVAEHQGKELERQVKRVLRLAPAIADPRLREHIALFTRANIDLIQSIPRQELDRVESIISRGQRQGTRVEVLREQIEKSFDVTTSRADLIARDQVLKLNSEVTQLRQRDLGITKYIWDTSKDERVRGSENDPPTGHAALDGLVFDWDDPPVVNDKGDTAHPGEDYQCRCVALPYIDLDAIPGDLE